MSNDETIMSAVLTATIKSVKMLTALREEQDTIISEIESIKTSQKETSKKLETLDTLATKDEVASLNDNVNELTELIKLIDIDAAVTSINEKLVVGQAKTQTEIDSVGQEILTAIAKSDSVENLETIKRLIEGLKNLQSNVVTVAERVEILSKNVKSSRDETKELVDSVIDSNARVKSMDMRMAALSTNSTTSTDQTDDVSDALALLESLEKPSNTVGGILDEI